MIERRHVLVLLAAGGLLAACGGGDGEAEPTTVVTSAPAPTTPAPTTTAESTTTPAPTTTPPTTAPPTTTADDVIAEVTAAALATYDFYWACLQRPVDCEPAEIAAPGSAALDGLTQTRDELVGAELYVADSDPGYVVVESVELDENTATVTSCWRLTATLLGPPGPDGVPTVQNDTPGYLRQVDEYVFVEAAQSWMISTSGVVEQQSEVNECPPEP